MPANLTFSANTNQITSANYTYDAAGNLTKDSSNATAHTYQWDAEGRVGSVDGGTTWTFTYNAVGNRVAWVSGGVTYDHLFDPAGNWLGVAGSYSIIMQGARPLVVYNSAETWFHHVNNIDSRTYMTNHYGTPTQDMVFYPWGGLWQSWGGGGLEFADLPYRDTTTNTDLTENRLFSPNIGRWHSPDPLGGSITNPQSLNRYAYVLNNPTSLTDPMGLGTCPNANPEGTNGRGQTIYSACNAEQAAQSNVGGLLGGIYTGNGASCYADGVQMNCGFAYELISEEAAALCPGNDCWPVNNNGQRTQYYSFGGMAAAMDGYYSLWGVGSLQYNLDQAGISASEWGSWYLQQTGSEVGGDLWCGYGICSSTLGSSGPSTQGFVNMNDNGFFQDIPGGTDPGGWWRATNAESPPSDIGVVNSWNAQLGETYPLFTGTTSGPGRVLYYGPGSGGQECVLTGGMWSYGLEGSCN